MSEFTLKGFKMGFRINTNVAALNAHRNSVMNNKALNQNLTRLSSGLRINKAADDGSGLAIADQLNSQANGLGQAIRNANDGINVAQTADGALQEYTNIINTVRTKAIQAASDGQNANSRKAIQRDINKLLEEAQNIATTTSFNGQNLLDGTFINKKFHIGAYADETVGISVQSTQISSIGAHVDDTGNAVTSVALAANDLTINGTDVGKSTADTASGANTTAHSDTSAWAKANAINSVSNSTGVTATAKTTKTGSLAVSSGNIVAGGLKINGIDIGAVTVANNDADNALMNAINAVSNKTNVTASHEDGKLVLTATDGSDIVLGGSTDKNAITHLGTNSGSGTTIRGKITLTSDKTVQLGGNNETYAGFTNNQVFATAHTLNAIDVTTRDNAESAIKTTDSALRQIDAIRSNIGSVQNQLESTVRNISVTQINVTAAKSTIMDVDFAAESASFAKHNILAQSGSYALSQANAVQQNVLRLLQ